MTVVFPPDPEAAPTPEDALQLTGFFESSVQVSRRVGGTGQLPVSVTFALSRPPSATEILIVDRNHSWNWRLIESHKQLVVDLFDYRDVEKSLREVRIRLAEITESALDVEAAEAAVVREVTLSLGIELRKL